MNSEKYIILAAEPAMEMVIGQIAGMFGLSVKPGSATIADLPLDTMLVFQKFYPHDSGTASIVEVFYHRSGRLRYAARRDFAAANDTRRLRWLARLNLYHLLCEVTGRIPSPWGTLLGVRPAKLVHKMLDAGCQPETIIHDLVQDYALLPEKAQLVTGIALRQRPFLLPPFNQNKVSVYIGIPFCPTRCLYCSFPSYVLPGRDAMQVFLAALFADMAAAKECLNKLGLSVQSVYVGGGTPTSLEAKDLAALLARTVELFAKEAEEFTVEAGRPDSLADNKIRLLADYGVDRVSVNPQTMQQKTLNLIGRMHSVQDIISVFGKMRMVNIPVINMDIIAGLPGESIEDMADTLKQIAALQPDNLTVHTLSLKRGSRLRESPEAYALPDAQTTADMLSLAGRTAAMLGMQPYYVYRQKKMAGNLENIGYALPDKECIYNIQIIEERQTIIGIGPSATTKVITSGGLTNFFLPKDLSTYINTLPERMAKREALLSASLGT